MAPEAAAGARRRHGAIDALERPLDGILQHLEGISRVLARAAGGLVLLTALVVSLEVALRGLFGLSVGVMHEISGYTLAVTSAWSFTYALFRKAHIRIDIGYLYTPPRIQRLLDVVAYTFLGVFCVLLVSAVWDVVARSYLRNSTATTELATPLWIPQSAWFVGLLLFAVATLVILMRLVLALFGGNEKQAKALAGAGPEDEPILTSQENM